MVDTGDGAAGCGGEGIDGDPPAPSWSSAAGREGRAAVVCWAAVVFVGLPVGL